MMETRDIRLSFTVAGSFVALILQVVIAPNIAILDVVPDFILCFVVVNALFSNKIRSSLTGFILGLLYDCIAQGSLGIMSLVLTVVAYGVSSLNRELFVNSWRIQALLLLIIAFMAELLHAVFLSVLGYDSNFLLSVGMRVIPSALYDALFGLIVFPLMYRFNERRKKDPGILRGKLS
jgi:rod shape-determining protein MreD